MSPPFMTDSYFFSCSFIAAAAFRPSPMARITVGTSADNVASGKDGRDGRLHVIIDGNRSLPAQFQSLDGAWDNRVGRYTYADDGKVDVDGFRGSGNGYGTAASAGIGSPSSIF